MENNSLKMPILEFNSHVAINTIDIRPDDTAYYNGKKYKIQKLKIGCNEIELKEIENIPSYDLGIVEKNRISKLEKENE